MYKVIINLEDKGQKDTLVEACRMFIEEIKKLIKGGVSEFVLYECCWVEKEVHGRKRVMNFDAVADFSRLVGILDEEGRLQDGPCLEFSEQAAQRILVMRDAASRNAFIREQLRALA